MSASALSITVKVGRILIMIKIISRSSPASSLLKTIRLSERNYDANSLFKIIIPSFLFHLSSFSSFYLASMPSFVSSLVRNPRRSSPRPYLAFQYFSNLLPGIGHYPLHLELDR